MGKYFFRVWLDSKPIEREDFEVMRGNDLYIQLKQIALDGGYTIQQVEQADFNLVAQLLGNPDGLTDSFVRNMKSLLIQEMQESIEQQDLANLRSQLIEGGRTWLLNNFPDAVFEKDNIEGKPCIKIWLKGKPDVDSI